MLGLAVEGRIAPRAKHPQEAPFLARENALLHQPAERTLADLVGARGSALQPVARIVRFGRRGNVAQRRVDQAVLQGSVIDEDQLVQVGVDAVFQCQFHQNSAAQGVAHQSVGNSGEAPIFIVEQKKHNFFGESQHTFPFRPSVYGFF